MGNTLLTSQKIACGHTDRAHLQQNLLCDRLSQPTAEMVDALLFLQEHTDELVLFGKSLLRPEPGSRPSVELVASCCCTLFEYHSARREGEEGQGVLAAFAGVLEQPQQFLQDLMSMRAQALPKEKITQVEFLLQEVDIQAATLGSDEVLEKVAAFVKAAVDCAKIYCEIREAAHLGQIDRHQAAKLLDSPESDQRRMISAMHTGRPDGSPPAGHKEP
ncbi:unnamed protein product [Symbiodinium natans]|uniref:Uncharacterized protein n=1 Tax=Symbiodinium natans TaxID=878477 RepID=A0A812NQJ4_9DINO|nr:unnamed protein product [Symbiodinium natans]